MPNSQQNGYLLIGVNDDGTLCGLKVTDELMKKISAIRTDGNILPLPVMNVEPFSFAGGEVLVVEVIPSALPPVRYRGRTFIRIGPRKDLATREEEEILAERRSSHFPTMDSTPCCQATLDDIDCELFVNTYLPKAIAPELLTNDPRTVKEQMISLRLFSKSYDCPTYAAILLFGRDPKCFLPGAYVQYVRWGGLDNASEILNQREFCGNLCTMLPQIDTFIDMAVVQKRPVPVSALREEIFCNYPKWSLRELLMNAIMHALCKALHKR
jgi:ATP-dependent DNA helicase RecG